MRSVRLDEETETQLEQISEMTGEPVSQIIRDAVRERCCDVLSRRADRKLAYVIGSGASGRRRNSPKTGKEFARLVSRRLMGKRR